MTVEAEPQVRRAEPASRRDRGQSTVELALIVPVVVLMLLAIIQVGVAIRGQILVTHAAREAARVLAVEVACGDGGLAPQRAVEIAREATGLADLDVDVDLAVVRETGLVVVTVGHRPPYVSNALRWVISPIEVRGRAAMVREPCVSSGSENGNF